MASMRTRGGEAELALERSRHLNRALLAAFPDLVFHVDRAGRFLDVQPGGAPPESAAYDLAGRCIEDVVPDADLRPTMQAAIDRVFATGAIETLEYQMNPGDGGLRSLQARFAPCTACHVVVLVRDVTHEKELERQVLVSQRMEAVGRLAGGIAHDFNNVLTVIQAYAELLRARFPERDPARADSELILDAVQRGARMTQHLLTFSRRQPQALETVSLNRVVTGLEKMLRRLIGEDIDLSIDLDQDLEMIWADHLQLEQVVMNLVVNARDAMPAGGRLTICTANVVLDAVEGADDLPAPGSYAALVVADDGVGMDEETRAQVFEPFFTTKQSSGGTGLGLSTVYGIVKQSGGLIRLSSEPGSGTTFEILLPRATGDSPEVIAAAEEPEEPKAGFETILLVEDDELVRRAGRRVLEHFGYRVLEASGGAEALRTLAEHEGPIDIAVTDLVMPLMSGAELAARLGETRPDLPILFVSGYGDDVLGPRGDLPGSPTLLSKPYSATDLVATIQAILGQERPSD